MSDLRPLAALVDGVLAAPAVVIGSLPAEARDLDVLTTRSSVDVLAGGLAGAGFARRDAMWLRVRGGQCWVADVHCVEDDDIPRPLAEAVLDAAEPLDGHRQLRRPAARHVLLLLAWRLSPTGGAVEARRRVRIAEELARDPGAWDAAGREAAGLGLVDQLGDLRSAYDGTSAVTAPAAGDRVRSTAGRVLRRSRRGGVVALSGIDGSGKSTQAKVLATALDALGHPTDTKWTRITYDPSLERVARPVKAALALAQRRRGAGTAAEPAPPVTPDADGAADADADIPDEPQYDERGNEIRIYVPHPGTTKARSLRQRSRLVAGAWTAVIALADARNLRRTTLPSVRQGVVVIRDRYVLDSTVQLFEQYGPRHRWQARLIAFFAPTPRRAFLLDVPAETAWERKPEEYDVDQLDRHRRRYLEHAGRLGVEVVDATRDRDTISTELVLQVWDALR